MQTNQVRDPNDIDSLENLDGSIYRWKPVSQTTTETSRGVEIIKNLVEQAKTTENVPSGAIQSLTTSKNKEVGRGFAVFSTAQTSTSTEEQKPNVPYNIKSNSNFQTDAENEKTVVVKDVTTNITPIVTLVYPSTEQTNTYIAPILPIDTTPSQTITTTSKPSTTSATPSTSTIPITTSTTSTTSSTTTVSTTTISTTTSSTTTPNPTTKFVNLRRGTTTNHPMAATILSTQSQDQSTLQRNLLLLQELLGLTENGARNLNQANPLKPTTVSMRRSTSTTSTTTTTKAPTSSTTTTTTPKPTTTTPEPITTSTTIRPAIQFNSIDDILNSLQTSRPTTQRPRTTTSAEVDDLTFINRLVITFYTYEVYDAYILFSFIFRICCSDFF